MEQLKIDFNKHSMTLAQAIFYAEALVGHVLFMYKKLKEEEDNGSSSL